MEREDLDSPFGQRRETGNRGLSESPDLVKIGRVLVSFYRFPRGRMSILCPATPHIERSLTTVLIRSRVSLTDSNAVRDIVLVVLGLSYFGVVSETSDQVHPS